MTADITVTAAKVGLVYPDKAEVHDFVAAEAITAGQLFAQDSNGRAVLSDANGSNTLPQVKGLALNSVGIGQSVAGLKRGHVYGFTLTNNAYDALMYASATAGAVSDTAAGINNALARVVALPDTSATKVLYFDISWAPVQA